MATTTNQSLFNDQQLVFETSTLDRKITFGSATGTTEGIEIEYDRLTTPKTFKITPAGINWTNGIDNHTTGLERLALVQTAFQAVELPPNATTLKLNDTILLDDGTTTTTTITNNQTQIIDTIVGTSINQITSEVNGGGASVLVGASDLVSSTGQFIRVEAPIGSDAIIEHQEVGTTNTRNLGISSTGRITMTADNIDLDTAGTLIIPSPIATNNLQYTQPTSNFKINQGTTGGVANPIISLNQNDTASGACNMTFYKNTFVNGSAIGELSFRAKTAITGNPEREYARIGGTIRSNTTGNVDGAINFQARINDTLTECMRINGQDSQIEIYQPLDLNDKDIVSSTGDIELNATASAGTGDILLNPKVATGYIKASKEILTDSIIATQSGFPSGVGSSLNFYPASPDYRFTIDGTKIELHYNNLTTLAYQTIYQNNTLGAEEAYFKQTFNDTTTGNTIETIIENDATHHRIKLSETASGANTEISKDEIDVDDGAGNVAKLTPTDLLFNNVSIRPRRTYNSVSFSVMGSPTNTILNFGSIADMVANTTWKVDVAFYTTALNTANILTYIVQDTTPQYVEQNSVLGYNNGINPGLINAQEYKSSGTTMSLYSSFTDTFEVNGLAVGACSFILTGGTSDSSTWGGGGATCRVSIVLTRLA